jgi:threonine dehydrogenase-like Zn-dependent dehydrogenase
MNPPLSSRQFWIRAPGQGEIRERPLPAEVEGAVRVRALYSGISRGTEALVFQGRVPPSQAQAMRAPFQEGDFPAPVKYGYCSVGRVEAVPSHLPPHLPVDLVGRTVFCLHPHQDLYHVPPEALAVVPQGVPPGRAVLAANLETAVNGVWDGAPGPGDRIVVVGGGVVGLLVAWLCRPIPGARVTVVDVDPARERTATALGVDFVLGDGGEGEIPPGEADLVFHVSGNPAGLAAALPLAGDEGTVVELSWYGDRPVALPLGEAFHSRRLLLRSSQVGRLPPHRRPRWDHRRRMGVVMELLHAGELDALISGESDFQDLPEVMARLASSPDGTLCHRIRYPASPDHA